MNIEPESKKSNKKLLIILLFLIISFGGNIYQGFNYNYLLEENIQLKNKVEKQKELINDNQLEINNLNSELGFYENNAVLVSEHGEKYHKYTCQYMKGKAYWIFNVEAAESKGYEPCSVCFGDESNEANISMEDYMKTMIEQSK